MATTNTPSGTLTLTAAMSVAFGGDHAGSRTASVSILKSLGAGLDFPITGYFKGTAICAAGDWLLAHASDPLQGMGDAAYSDGFTAASSKLTVLLIQNNDSTNSITISRGTLNGLPIFGAADDAVTITAGGLFCLVLPAGTAALTSGTNDKLTIAVSGGTPSATVLACYRS